MPNVLVTGATGFLGAALLPRLQQEGHAVRAYARRPEAVAAGVPVVQGDAVQGTGLDAALDGIDVAYYLIHSMERASQGSFEAQERAAAERFAQAADAAGVRRVVYLGGLVPQGAPPSTHLRSRLAVEEILLRAAPESVALRASIVIGARSRSFRFLVRLIERLPVLALPAWRNNETRPIDGRDVLEFLARSATVRDVGGRSLDIAGPDVLTYGDLIERIRDLLMLNRPSVSLPVNMTAVASQVAAAIAGEDPGLIEPLMESLEHDLLPRHDDAAAAFGVRPRRFEAAVERALRDWERDEEVAAR